MLAQTFQIKQNNSPNLINYRGRIKTNQLVIGAFKTDDPLVMTGNWIALESKHLE